MGPGGGGGGTAKYRWSNQYYVHDGTIGGAWFDNGGLHWVRGLTSQLRDLPRTPAPMDHDRDKGDKGE